MDSFRLGAVLHPLMQMDNPFNRLIQIPISIDMFITACPMGLHSHQHLNKIGVNDSNQLTVGAGEGHM